MACHENKGEKTSLTYHFLKEKNNCSPKETDFQNLTAQQVIEKIRAFYFRLEKKNTHLKSDELLKAFFLS